MHEISRSVRRLSVLQLKISSSTVYYNNVHNRPSLLFIIAFKVVHLFVLHVRPFNFLYAMAYLLIYWISPSKTVLDVINKKAHQLVGQCETRRHSSHSDCRL